MTAADKRKGCGCLTVIGLLGVAVVVGLMSDHSGAPSTETPSPEQTAVQSPPLSETSTTQSPPKLVYYPGQASCWKPIEDDPDRPDVSCVSFSEANVGSLLGMSRNEVQDFMRVPGQFGTGLHFISNDIRVGDYNGTITLTYAEDDRVRAVQAIVTRVTHNGLGDQIEYIANANGFWCSDYPGSHKTCRSSDGD